MRHGCSVFGLTPTAGMRLVGPTTVNHGRQSDLNTRSLPNFLRFSPRSKAFPRESTPKQYLRRKIITSKCHDTYYLCIGNTRCSSSSDKMLINELFHFPQSLNYSVAPSATQCTFFFFYLTTRSFDKQIFFMTLSLFLYLKSYFTYVWNLADN